MTNERRREGDKGASLVEVGFLIPMLLLLTLGLTEVGFLVIDYVTVTNSARSGARVGAAASTSSGADDEILRVVEEDACNLRYGDLEEVMIFRVESDGSVPTDSSFYRIYKPAGALLCDNPNHNLALDTGTWVPSSRDNVLPTLDKIGVRIEFTHNKVTNWVPFPTAVWTETAVMQLEPDTKGP